MEVVQLHPASDAIAQLHFGTHRCPAIGVSRNSIVRAWPHALSLPLRLTREPAQGTRVTRAAPGGTALKARSSRPAMGQLDGRCSRFSAAAKRSEVTTEGPLGLSPVFAASVRLWPDS